MVDSSGHVSAAGRPGVIMETKIMIIAIALMTPSLSRKALCVVFLRAARFHATLRTPDIPLGTIGQRTLMLHLQAIRATFFQVKVAIMASTPRIA